MHKLTLTLVAACLVITSAGGCAQKKAPASPIAPIPTAEFIKKNKANLVSVKGGEFQMGDFGEIHSEEKLPYSYEHNDGPLHKVVLSDFAILKYQVTLGDYAVYVTATGKPHHYLGTRQSASQKRELAHARGPEIPVSLDWQMAKDYCQWLGKTIGQAMDLPTEAEWEFAARNRGALVIYPTNDGQEKPGVNFASSHQAEAFSGRLNDRMAVGMFPPTPLGLYDMGDNGAEWVHDWYAETYYAASPADNPKGPAAGTERVVRSGGNGGDHAAMTFERSSDEPVSPDGELPGWNSNTFRCVARPVGNVAS